NLATYKHRPNIKITHVAGTPCSGTPTAGTATVSTRNCASEPVTLALTGNTIASGMTIQWQSSPAGANTFTNISGATNASYTVTNQTASTDYRCIVTCTNSNNSATSNIVTAIQPTALTNLSENFDTTPTGSTSNVSIPACWSFFTDITSTVYSYVEAATARSAANSFRLYRSNTTANSAQSMVLLSPETVNLGNGTKQLRFYAMATNTNASNILEIVRANGTTSAATITVLQTIVVNHTSYEEYIVPLPVTTDDYFGFRLVHNNTTS